MAEAYGSRCITYRAVSMADGWCVNISRPDGSDGGVRYTPAGLQTEDKQHHHAGTEPYFIYAGVGRAFMALINYLVSSLQTVHAHSRGLFVLLWPMMVS